MAEIDDNEAFGWSEPWGSFWGHLWTRWICSLQIRRSGLDCIMDSDLLKIHPVSRMKYLQYSEWETDYMTKFQVRQGPKDIEMNRKSIYHHTGKGCATMIFCTKCILWLFALNGESQSWLCMHSMINISDRNKITSLAFPCQIPAIFCPLIPLLSALVNWYFQFPPLAHFIWEDLHMDR